MFKTRFLLLYVCFGGIGLFRKECEAQIRQLSVSGQTSDIAVSSTGQLFVGANVGQTGSLTKLNGTLVQQEVLLFPSRTSVLRIALSPDESRLVTCVSNRSCLEYDVNNLSKGPVGVFYDILAGSSNVALVSAPVSGGGNSFYVGSSNGSVNLIGQYGLDGTAGNVSRSSGNLFSVTASSFTRNWFGGFVAGNYTYFVVFDVSTSTAPTGMRVLRVCGNSFDTSVAAMYEAEINCIFLEGRIDPTSRFAGVSLVNMYPNGTSFDAKIVVGAVTPNINGGAFYSRLGTFSLSNIDSAIASASSLCSPGALPWRSSTSSPTCYSPCNISSPGASPTSTLVQDQNGLLVTSVTNMSFDLSYTLSFNYESLTLLFIAYTSQLSQAGQSSMKVYKVTDGSSLGVQFSIWSMPGPVTKLTWTSGQNYVYAITSTSVVQVPIEQCSNFTDCLSCTANVNPLCGWCTVEQKCSRRSQCQNSTVSTRWVQGGTNLCLSNTSVTPTKFVLETPTNITLTIIPGLPPLLAGESFLCLLTTGSGVTISVPYSPANQTTFTSNITGAISQLHVPKLVVYVGFGSSLLNIPFATGTLTAYNCLAATSCSSCLQSDGVCGWCNVEKRCTAVTSSCSNGISVNTTGGQTYSDVCPSLLNGTYLLPVTVSRGLVLNTKNLPPQFPGYQYLCTIQSTAISLRLNTSYISNTSIKCLFTAAQISLPVGTTAMVANISLIWTNSGTVMYPIDPLGVIQVTLYNCSAVIPVCTSCLAVNIGTGYDCGWCNGISSCVEPETCLSTFANQTYQCPSPMLSSVSPTSGPFGGGTNLIITGTNLGVKVEDIVSVTVGGVPCVVQSYGYKPGVQVICVTGAYTSGGTSLNVVMTINRSGTMATAQSNLEYTYVKPSISSVFPKSGPMSGGTNVVIGGMFLNVGNGLKAVLLDGAVCVILQSSLTQVTCTSSAQNVTGVGLVTVYIDNDTTTNNGVTFEYTNNPNYTSVSPASTIPAGGIILTFNGTYLNVTQKAYLKGINGMMEECNQSFTTLLCIAPPLGPYLSGPGVSLFPGVNYTIVMDGAAGPNLTIGVVPNPVFTSINMDDITQVIGSVKIIRINGMNIMSVNVLSEIVVTVGGGRCIIDLGITTDTVLSCRPPQNLSTVSTSSSKKRQSSNGRVVVEVGKFLSYTPGVVTYFTGTSPPSAGPFPVVPVAMGVGGGVLALFLVMVVVMVAVIVRYKWDSTKKSHQVDNLLMMLETWETNMADECKRAFTELQTDLQDVVNVQDKNFPYRDFRSFAMKFLFPTAEDDHPILKPVQFPAGVDLSEARKKLEMFEELILDKKVLLVMIHTLEGQHGRFSLQDRCNVASLLIVAIQKNLSYATDILQTLLASHIRASATKGNPKLLLRRTESLAEKLLSNWLCFLLYPYVQEHAGEPLFILFRAIKSQLEKGPVDVITGEARNSLSEEKLLRQHLDVNIVEGVVENGNDVIPIKLLDSDTISQAKEKILDVLHRNTPVSRRPQLSEVDLELRRGAGGVLLRDHDSSNQRDGDWVKVNTLGHYKLDHMSKAHLENEKNAQPNFRLLPRSERPLSMISLDTLGTMVANITSPSRNSLMLVKEEDRVYHLVRPEAVDVMAGGEGGVQRQGNKIMSEVFLTRLLSTKRILQPYVDDLFKAVFSIPNEKPIPKAVKCLFDFLDLQAADLGITDPDVLHTWKTNSLLLRFWVSLIKNPDFVFDIHKSATVDSCLSVISQAYIDACSTTETKYTKDTPSAKLLYVNEVRHYKDRVRGYYDTVQSSPKLDNQDMDEYLRTAVQPAQLLFSTDGALYELFKYAVQYSDDIIAALREKDLTDQALAFQSIADTLK